MGTRVFYSPEKNRPTTPGNSQPTPMGKLATFLVGVQISTTGPRQNSLSGGSGNYERKLRRLEITKLYLLSENACLASENAALLYDSQHDALTGALNEEGLKQFIKEDTQKYPGGSRGLIYFDLKEFRTVNNRYGHAYANNVLASIGKSFSRESGTLARLHSAGDEFALFTDTTNLSSDQTRTQSIILADQVRYLSTNLRNVILNTDATLQEHYPGSVAHFGAIPYDHAVDFETNISVADFLMTTNKSLEQ